MIVDKNCMCTLSEEDCSYHSCDTKQTNDKKRQEFIKIFGDFPDQIIALALAYADCMIKYGVDVSAQWQTVTIQRDALNRAYLQGRMDEAKKEKERNHL